MQTFDKKEFDKFLPFFREHGWLHIKNLFTAEEIENFRKNAYKMKSENYRGDILAFPETSSLIYDERIVNIVKLLLTTDKPVYFGDSSAYNIGNAGASGFHKDNPDKFEKNNPDWQSEYTLLRMGIYCQSHVDYSGSVALRDKSHNTISDQIGEPFLVNNDAGDLVIWSLRTSHSGNSKRFKFAPDFFLHPRFYKRLPAFLYKEQQKERVAYFMTYAKNDLHLRRYLTYLLNRQYMVGSWQKSNYSKEILEGVKKANNIQLVNMYEIVKDVDINTVKKDHTELPASMEYFEPHFL